MLIEVFYIVIYVFLGLGIFFNLLAGVGLLRFPDVYTRLHAGTKCTTFGSIFICGSVILIGLKMWYYNNTNGLVLLIHTGIALAAILLTNPTGAHAIARAAYRSGIKPARAVIDDLSVKSRQEEKIDKKLFENGGEKKK
jgi:multicomponent Na+:H+ antiporter subunit G